MSDEWEVVRGGLDSLAWLLNNAHNHDADNWPNLVKAAREDRDRALIALDVLRLQNEALRERNAELERVLANLGVRLNAGSSGDPAGGEVE